MADNVDLPAASGKAAADEVTYSGDTSKVQLARLVAVTGSEGSKTVVENMPASLGQKAKAASFPVTLASDEDALALSGDVAHDSADSGNPVKIGGIAADIETPPTAVGVGDRVNAYYTDRGIAAVMLVDAGTGFPASPLPVRVDVITNVDVSSIAAGDNNIGNVDVASSALPTGAATAAKQPALGTAGTSSADVITVQGRASMTPVLVDGSATTQPISGTVTANVGTGTQAVSGTVTANIGTGTLAAVTAITNVVHVDDNAGSLTVDGTFWQATQPVSGTVAVTGVATETSVAAAATSLAALDDLVIAEDAAHANGDKGIVALAVRRDTATSSTVTDGDYGTLTTDTAGRLRTSSADTTQPVSGTFWQATQPVSGTVAVTGVATETSLAAVLATAGAIADASVTAGATGSISAKLRRLSADLNTAMTSLSGILTYTSLAVAHFTDDASSGSDGGAPALVIRDDALTTLTPVDGDYDRLRVDSVGRLWTNGSGVTQPVSLASTTVTGTVAVTQSGTWDEVGINDSGNSITVDGTITASNTAGDIAHDAADSGNPVKMGMKANNALPTAVANNDRANAISDLFGRQLVSHIDPAMQVSKAFNATTTQTGIDVWSPTSGKKIAVTSVVIGTYGTTAARVILWFGDNADTTYSAGTDQLLLAASFVPSATAKPGLVFTPSFPVFCTTADRELHVTTDAGISLDIAVNGYEWV